MKIEIIGIIRIIHEIRTRECERKWKDVPKTMHILKIPRLCWGVWSIDVTRVTVGSKLKIEIIESAVKYEPACYRIHT